MSRPNDPRSADKKQKPKQIAWPVPLLNEARDALATKDRERLFQYIAENPYLLDADQGIRRWWVQEIVELQGNVVAYERILRYYKEIGAPPHRAYAEALREQIQPGEQAAALARKELLEVGKRFVEAAVKKWDPWKGQASTKKALALIVCAHKVLSSFYRSVRREAKTYRRRWDQLSREDRIHIVNSVPEVAAVLSISGDLWGTFPEAKWRMPDCHPFFYFVDNPEEYMVCIRVRPSEIAWKALAQLMGAGEATLRRWVQRGVGPRPRT